MPVIRVVAALLVDGGGRMCLVRKRGTDAFMQPGGKPEAGESPTAALARELREELGLDVAPQAMEPLGRFEAAAANEAGHTVVAEVFRVVTAERPGPHAEIAEVRWLDAAGAIALGARLAPLARRLIPLVHPDRGLAAAYDAIAPAYAAAVPDLGVEAPLERGMLDGFLRALPPRGRLLDAGCGAGRLLVRAAAARPDLRRTGADLSAAMTALAGDADPGARVVTADLAALPFPDAAFDGVLAWYSLIHLAPAALPAVLGELRRVLRPGGALLAAFQAGTGERRVPRPYGTPVDLVAHLHPLDGMERAMRDAGLVPRSRAQRPPRAIERHAQAVVRSFADSGSAHGGAR